MANLISKTDRFVYVRVALPRPTFDALTEWFGNENLALRNLRLDWQKIVADWDAELRPATRSDASGSAAGPGSSAPDVPREKDPL